MGRLSTIDGQCTSPEGLWFHPECNYFSSAAFSIGDLRKFKGNVRLYVRKNRQYNNGENGRPNYHFWLADAKSESQNELRIENNKDEAEWMWSEVLDGMTILEGYECSNCEYPNGYKTSNYCPGCGAKMKNGDEWGDY